MRMPEPEEDKVTATGGGARQRATEARRRPQEPPEERSVCTTVRFNQKFSRSMLLCVCVFF